MSFEIIIVSYHSLTPIIDLYKTIPPTCQIIIVDNSSDSTLAEWSKNKTNIRYIDAKDNIGFGKACNLGASQSNSEWLFFLNPDTQLPSDIVSKFNEIIQELPEVKIFAPTLVGKNGAPNFKKRSGITVPKKNPDYFIEHHKTPILSGAAFFVRKDFFNQLNGFDENIFMYFEDDDFFWRAFQANKNIILTNHLKVLHLEGGSSPHIEGISEFKSLQWGQSEAYVLIKHKRFFKFFIKFIEYILKWFLGFFIKKYKKYSWRLKGFSLYLKNFRPKQRLNKI